MFRNNDGKHSLNFLCKICFQPSNKKKKEIDRCNNLIDRLEDEMKKQADHVARVKARLEEEKELWFPTGEHCISMTFY